MGVVGGTNPKGATAREAEIELRNYEVCNYEFRNTRGWILAFSIWRSVMAAVAARIFLSHGIYFGLAFGSQTW